MAKIEEKLMNGFCATWTYKINTKSSTKRIVFLDGTGNCWWSNLALALWNAFDCTGPLWISILVIFVVSNVLFILIRRAKNHVKRDAGMYFKDTRMYGLQRKWSVTTLYPRKSKLAHVSMNKRPLHGLKRLQTHIYDSPRWRGLMSFAWRRRYRENGSQRLKGWQITSNKWYQKYSFVENEIERRHSSVQQNGLLLL